MTFDEAKARGVAVRRASWPPPFAVRWDGARWRIAAGWCVGAIWNGASPEDVAAGNWVAA